MKESTIYGLVFAAVLVTAALGLFFAFSYAPRYGKSIEGAKTFAEVREPYGGALESNIKDLAFALRQMPPLEIPYSYSGKGACLIFWSPYTGALFSYPVKWGDNPTQSAQLFEGRGHILIDFQEAQSSDRLCPDLQGVTLVELLEKRGAI
ncbi:hypothetical protein KY329_00735 [Candidatus Woesearchaeota archaeon]|nr:hypothetical protein [Candidatus Woesearchaeota archaeon]